MAGKGSRPRPYSVDQKTFDSNWDAIFGKKKNDLADFEKDFKDIENLAEDILQEDLEDPDRIGN